jgi:hypothetical protein
MWDPFGFLIINVMLKNEKKSWFLKKNNNMKVYIKIIFKKNLP